MHRERDRRTGTPQAAAIARGPQQSEYFHWFHGQRTRYTMLIIPAGAHCSSASAHSQTYRHVRPRRAIRLASLHVGNEPKRPRLFCRVDAEGEFLLDPPPPPPSSRYSHAIRSKRSTTFFFRSRHIYADCVLARASERKRARNSRALCVKGERERASSI